MRFAFYVVLSSVILSGTAANATTFYVSLSGNDASAGTLAAPLRTVTKAGTLAKPGDAIEVRGGIYNERISLYCKGTAAAPIVIRNYGTERPIFDGTTVAVDKPVVNFNATEYVDFRGFEIRNASYMGINLRNVKHTRILNNEIYGSLRNGIYVGGDVLGANTNVTVSGNLVHDNVRENQVHTTDGGWAGALVVSKTDGAIVTNNKVWNNDGEGILLGRGDNMLVEGNETFDNFSVNIYIDNARFITVNRNLIYSTGNSRYYRNGYPAAGIMVANETNTNMNLSTDNVITNNIVVGTRWGFYYGSFETGGGLKNTSIVNNTFYGTHQDILHIDTDAHANSVVKNNIFVQTNGTSAAKVAGAGVSYRRNLWYGGAANAAAGVADIIGNPLFVKAGGFRADDYKLQPLSVALHGAEDDTLAKTDFFGEVRTASYDLGAHELSVSLGSSAPGTIELTAPTAVRADVSKTSTSVRVSWNAPKGVSSFNVYRNGTYLDTVANAIFNDTAVAAGNTYSYEIASNEPNLGIESARTAPVSVKIADAGDTENPIKPGTPRLVSATSNTVSIRWTASTDNVGVNRYDVYRNGTRIATVTNMNFTDSKVAAATTYEYAIVARDAADNASPRSSSLSVTTAKAAGRGRSVRK